MRITITCEECGRRHQLERAVDDPGPIWIICHDCELPLRAVLEPEALAAARSQARQPHVEETFRSAWSGTLELPWPRSTPANS